MSAWNALLGMFGRRKEAEPAPVPTPQPEKYDPEALDGLVAQLEAAAVRLAEEGGAESAVASINLASTRHHAEKAEMAGDWQAAIDGWTKVLRTARSIGQADDEFLAGAMYRRAKVLTAARRYDEAMDDVENALSLDSEKAPIWSCKAGLLMIQDKNDEALKAAIRAIQLDQSDETAQVVFRGLVQRGVIPTVTSETETR